MTAPQMALVNDKMLEELSPEARVTLSKLEKAALVTLPEEFLGDDLAKIEADADAIMRKGVRGMKRTLAVQAASSLAQLEYRQTLAHVALMNLFRLQLTPEHFRFAKETDRFLESAHRRFMQTVDTVARLEAGGVRIRPPSPRVTINSRQTAVISNERDNNSHEVLDD